uniref:Uncharacterized protein n=1 Tax=uncultured organism MedDCM-OCT-S08-C288 TaxID=743637 RepID=D6PJ92_9ZZZZ|nr:hypothetical protein [uncultured organism MedDCM-OCT-S08-C288]
MQFLDKNGTEDGDELAFVSRAGRARAVYPSGDVYVGQFDADGRKQGMSTYYWAAGADEEVNVEDESTYKAKYEGEYLDGKRHGSGTMVFPDGSVYEGDWARDAREGEGLYTYPSGDMYAGHWKSNLKHGEGTYLYESNQDSHLRGTWKDGEVDAAEWVFNDGTIYRGDFSDSAPKGRGAYSYSNGNVQVGSFQPGNMPQVRPFSRKHATV